MIPYVSSTFIAMVIRKKKIGWYSIKDVQFVEDTSIFRWWTFGCWWLLIIFPQQRKLMGSSAQNSSGAHWCRSRIRFNEGPEKVPKVPEKVWEALVQSQVTFNTGEGSGEGSGEGLGDFGVEPGQVQQLSGEASGKGSRKPWCKAKSSSTMFQRRFRRRSGRLWFWARSGSTGFRRRFRRRF